MSESLRKKKSELIASLGFLVRPIFDLIADPNFMSKLPQIETRFSTEIDTFNSQKLNPYGKLAQIYASESFRDVNRGLCDFFTVFKLLRELKKPELAKEEANNLYWIVLRRVEELTADDPSTIMPAKSPFSTYCLLLEVFQTAQKKVELFDPYLGKDIFHLYFNDVKPEVEIIVVTDNEGTMDRAARRNEVVAVSKLLARQKPDKFSLLVVTDMHDRWLRWDDTHHIHLGSSVKDAANRAPYAILTAPPNQNIDKELNKFITNAVEWYGPNQRDPDKIDQASQTT